jgi:hypothetical protein
LEFPELLERLHQVMPELTLPHEPVLQESLVLPEQERLESASDGHFAAPILQQQEQVQMPSRAESRVSLELQAEQLPLMPQQQRDLNSKVASLEFRGRPVQAQVISTHQLPDLVPVPLTLLQMASLAQVGWAVRQWAEPELVP